MTSKDDRRRRLYELLDIWREKAAKAETPDDYEDAQTNIQSILEELVTLEEEEDDE